MITLLFIFLMISIFGKLLIFAVKASWGITKILFTVILLPLVLTGLAVAGLVYIALPVLLVAGVISMLGRST
ncbi:MAG: hypothetical protein Q4F83_04565 [Eubacteriales bacterium]|nr:hypothetical protein [Eubacteriales bacterium]